MKNKKKCTHKNGFKKYIWKTPKGRKVEMKTCKKCKKKIIIGECE